MSSVPDDSMSVVNDSEGVHRFSAPAMGTTFGIAIASPDAEYAQSAARAAFDELGPLEQELSRFIETSDVSRVSLAAAGEVNRIGVDFVSCLTTASDVCVGTGGAFDITVGALLSCWVDEAGEPRTPSTGELDVARRRTGMSLIELDEENSSVAVRVAGVQIDLGGIGKGHALDVMARTLADWDVRDVLLHSGQSTILALGGIESDEGRAWTLGLRDPRDQTSVVATVRLTACAISGSGRHVHGAHILDPRTSSPVRSRTAAWSVAESAATSDALSTAFMVMSDDEVAGYCRARTGAVAILFDDGDTEMLGGRAGFTVSIDAQ